MNTEILANTIKEKEKLLWGNPLTGEIKKPFIRAADNNLQIIQDMSMLHGLDFLATEKHNKEGSMNAARVMINDRKVIIHPRCVNLINHLKFAQWDKHRRDFRRSSVYGHYDALAALVYLIRNVVYSKNPFPKNVVGENYFDPNVLNKPLSDEQKFIKNIFSLKRK
jgi:hypothetical protein